MSEILAGNIEALAARYPDLAKRIAAASIEITGLTVAVSASGRPYLRLAAGAVSRALENSEDPGAEARKKIGELKESVECLILKGGGLGYLLKAAHARRSIRRVFLVEPNLALFALMLRVSDFRRVLEDARVDVYVGEEAGAAPARLKAECDYGTEANAVLVVLPEFAVVRHPVMDVSPDFELAFDRALGVIATASERNRLALDRFADIWRRHILENMPLAFEGAAAAALAGTARGLPGILVGAGPSLDRNVEVLRGVAGSERRAVIVAVDTAYRTLKAAGVVPDFVVAVDATEENLRDFDGVAPGDDPTSLIMVPVVHPKIPAIFPRRYTAGYGHPLQKWIESILRRPFGSLLISGSVATIGYDLLRRMNASPIILVGMDLAVSSVSHTRGALPAGAGGRFGTNESAAWRSTRGAGEAVDGWGGGRARTTVQMRRWIEWFEQELKRVKWPTVNATEGGARIAGAEEMTLAAAIERHAARRPVRLPSPRSFARDDVERLATEMKSLAERSRERPEELDGILKWERVIRPADRLGQIREEFREGLLRCAERLAEGTVCKNATLGNKEL